MAIPPWTVEILRRGLNDVARKARQPDTLEKIKSQASEMLHDLPETAARGIEAMMRTAEAGKQSVERWARRHTAIAIPTINATGVLLGDDCPDVPLSNDAVELGRELFAGGVVVGPMLEQKLERLLPHGKDYAMAVASSFPAALTALSLLVQER